MDNKEVYDSKFNYITPSKRTLLENKKENNCKERIVRNSTPRSVLPNYRFEVLGFSIGSHVEYTVLLHEEFSVFGKKVSCKYEFRTRFSFLEALDKKLGGRGLPPKKFFGNKDPSFLEKRKGQIEVYLNRLTHHQSEEFYSFISQIRNADFNKNMTPNFSLD